MSVEITKVSTEYGVADIYIAGSVSVCKELCKEFCLSGFCVNVSECDFIYTGGSELGCKIGLINYARFPESQDGLTKKAIDLAEKLIVGLHQSSATVLSPCGSFFLSRRELIPT